ncbi:centrosomal protein of 63 kDa-like isoform X2 [Pomacea canaliculata]|uniref:centrosomal protein of 63 kDa-like isoform X2 n=1 Tax=Pomacea canaliculata TaxID=400727 RepID=UPI000D7363FB|nr:centrosomal protein of 63 kDa-like isoform X2 [Pomacea canaliculata]
MERLSSVWAELQKTNKLPSSSLMSTCQTELHELMYQLDIMFSSKKQEWLQEVEDLQVQLHSKDREIRSQRTELEIKTREIEDMKNQLEGVNKTQKAIVSEYEEQLSKLQGEVQKVQKEYEKLYKQHQRYRRDLQRKKTQVLEEKKESMEELSSMKEKLAEYESKEVEWKLQSKNHQQEIEMLEAQKRTLLEKCELIKQQAQTYQAQIGRRREMQHSSEDSLKSQIVQLELKVESATQTLATQKEKIEKLKHSLETTMASHKQTMSDNEKLLDDLQKANETIQMLEERIVQLERECRTKSELLAVAQEDLHQYSTDLTRMEKTMDAKDSVIKQLGDTLDHEESEKVKKLKDALQSARDDLNISKQNMMQMEQKLSASSNQLDFVKQEQESVRQRLKDKEKELNHTQNTEVQQLRTEIKQLQDKLNVVSESHRVEIGSLQKILAELTVELNQSNKAITVMGDRSSELERSVQEEIKMREKKVAELKVAQLLVEALRAENHHLRQELLHSFPSNENAVNQHTLTDLQEQNLKMQCELSALRNSIGDIEFFVRRQRNSATELNNSSFTGQSDTLREKHPGTEEFEFLETGIKQCNDQLQFLEAQKARLEAHNGSELSHKSLHSSRRKPSEGGSCSDYADSS